MVKTLTWKMVCGSLWVSYMKISDLTDTTYNTVSEDQTSNYCLKHHLRACTLFVGWYTFIEQRDWSWNHCHTFQFSLESGVNYMFHLLHAVLITLPSFPPANWSNFCFWFWDKTVANIVDRVCVTNIIKHLRKSANLEPNMSQSYRLITVVEF